MAKRILHVVGGMDRGGIETWLMHTLRHIDRRRFQMDFLVHTEQKCAYDEEILGLGSRIIPCLHPSHPLTYGRRFKKITRECGPYDVVHSHVHHFSGYVLRLAKQARVPRRIAHSHNDIFRLNVQVGFWRKIYLRLMKRWVKDYATVGLGLSRQAGEALFGPDWQSDPRWRIYAYGVDLTPFRSSLDLPAVRRELGISADALVIGHVGRFMEQKNHGFLVEIFREVARLEPKARLLLVGDGPLRSRIELQVVNAGLTDQVIFTGVREDVPQLMLGAMDLFLFPSLFEGLGLVLIEAQAAGLPCIFSDTVPEEADVVGPLVRRVSLAQPASVWAKTVIAARDTRNAITSQEALAMVEQSAFNISSRLKELEGIYES